MRKRAILLLMFCVAVFLIGCQAAKVKQAVEGLKKDVAEMGTKIEETKTVFAAVDEIEECVTEKECECEKFMGKIDEAKAVVAEGLALEKDVAALKDSLAVLDKKATGKVKEDATALAAEVDGFTQVIEDLKAADTKLDECKALCEERLAAKEKKPSPPPRPPAKK